MNIKKEDIRSQYKTWAWRGHVFNGHWDLHYAPTLQQEVGLCPSLAWAAPNSKQIRMQVRPEYLTDIQSNRNGTHSSQMDGQNSTKIAYCYVMWNLKWVTTGFGRRATVTCLENMQRLRLWGTLVRRSRNLTLLQGKYRHELLRYLLQSLYTSGWHFQYPTTEITASVNILYA